jgi:hypothetical protein
MTVDATLTEKRSQKSAVERNTFCQPGLSGEYLDPSCAARYRIALQQDSEEAALQEISRKTCPAALPKDVGEFLSQHKA